MQLQCVRRILAAGVVLVAATAALAQTRLASEGAPPPTPATAPATAPHAEGESFLALMLRGGWAMIPLGACSLIGLALIIERGLALRRGQIMPAGFVPGLEKVYRRHADVEAALAYCRERPSAVSRIMAAGLRKLELGVPAAEQAIADQGATEVARMRRNLRLLHGIAAITPTLGLLGTVWGMIKAFQSATALGLGSHSDKLTQGIYESLVATMAGLGIAVPVLIVYYAYLGMIDRALLDLNDVTTAFIERHEHAAVIARPAAPSSAGEGVNSSEPVAT